MEFKFESEEGKKVEFPLYEERETWGDDFSSDSCSSESDTRGRDDDDWCTDEELERSSRHQVLENLKVQLKRAEKRKKR